MDNEGGIWLRERGAKAGGTLREAHLGLTAACAWLADGRRLVSTGEDGAVRLWDGRTRRLVATFQFLPPPTPGAPRKEWIIYTPAGYYEASPGSARWIRWRLDGRLYPASRYESRFQSKQRVLQALAE